MIRKLPKENEEVHIRQIKGVTPWFVANSRLSNSSYAFDEGLLLEVTFNPKAKVMKDVFCSTGRISEADAKGKFKRWKVPHEETIERRVKVTYDSERKCFHNKADPAEILTTVPMLLLNEFGQAEAIWLKPAA